MLMVGVVLLIISLILMVAFNVLDLIDELSGRKAKRQIKRLKELNIGTGGLEGLPTDEVYETIPSGFLLSEEIKKVDTSTVDDSDNIKTGYMGEECSTTYMDDGNVTGILSDISELCSMKHQIQIIEEQSSIF